MVGDSEKYLSQNESSDERSSAGHTLSKKVQRVKNPDYDSANSEMKLRTLDRTREEFETKDLPRLTGYKPGGSNAPPGQLERLS